MVWGPPVDEAQHRRAGIAVLVGDGRARESPLRKGTLLSRELGAFIIYLLHTSRRSL
jgi:hypothetical protein